MKKIFLILLILILVALTAGLCWYVKHQEKKINSLWAERESLRGENAEYEEKLKALPRQEDGEADLVLATLLVEDSYEKVRVAKIVLRDFVQSSDGYLGEYWLLLVDADGKILDERELTGFAPHVEFDFQRSDKSDEKSLWNQEDFTKRKVGLYYGPDLTNKVDSYLENSSLWIYIDNDFFPRFVLIEDDKFVFYQ